MSERGDLLALVTVSVMNSPGRHLLMIPKRSFAGQQLKSALHTCPTSDWTQHMNHYHSLHLMTQSHVMHMGRETIYWMNKVGNISRSMSKHQDDISQQ